MECVLRYDDEYDHPHFINAYFFSSEHQTLLLSKPDLVQWDWVFNKLTGLYLSAAYPVLVPYQSVIDNFDDDKLNHWLRNAYESLAKDFNNTRFLYRNTATVVFRKPKYNLSADLQERMNAKQVQIGSARHREMKRDYL